jgi:hypothetical protein
MQKDARYLALVKEGQQLSTQTSDNCWRLGELACAVVKDYGSDALGVYAADIGANVGTLRNCRSTVRAWPEKELRSSFSVNKALNAYPQRKDIIREQPSLTVDDATAITKAWRDAQPPKPPKKKKNKRAKEDLAATLVLDKGYTLEEAAAEAGVGSVQVVKTAVAREEGRREQEEEEVDVETLPKSTQQKLKAAERKLRRELELEFEQRFADEKDAWVLKYQKVVIDAKRLFEKRRGMITKEESTTIERCLHPDNSASTEMRNKAFVIWQRIKHSLMSEKDSPTVVDFEMHRKKRA